MYNRLKRTWAEIDLDALANNYHALRRQAGETTKFLGIVKADGYGHGAVRIARKLEQLGADYLGVSNVEEAAELRHHGIGLPILLLGYTPNEMTEDLIDLNVTQDVSTLTTAKAYSAAAVACGKTLKVHIKLDTGMGRMGFVCDETQFGTSVAEILQVLALPNLDCEGVFTHFAVSDEPTKEASRDYTALQFARFKTMIETVEAQSGHTFALHHCCNSGGVLYYPEYAWDLCRPGIVLYGYEPKDSHLRLRPVMTVKTAIGPVKDYAPDVSVSYGRTYTTSKPQRIGVLPIGYADGLLRCLSGKWSVTTAQGKAPICGRICMDMCMVDLTDLPEIGTGDTVEVFGLEQTADDMAEVAGTISYEINCAVSKRVPRVYLEGGHEVDYQLQLLL
ncbi:alanine racemase [Bengtsoniella intestinalis]|uniref:alanine racemase n=1 Tax=Bengtsoniella intestinalis TaxID=3073143 RepID=UPI00391F0462